MAKKKGMTATEAAEKLTKAFKLSPPLPARWSAIFRAAEELGHSARVMINADEGALVQSERLGFSNGGGSISGKKFADSAILDNWGLLIDGEEDLSKYKGDIKTIGSVANSPNFGDDSNEERDKNRAVKAYRDAIVGGGHDFFGTRGSKGIRWFDFDSYRKLVDKTPYSEMEDPPDVSVDIYKQNPYIVKVGSTELVGVTDPETGKFRPLTFNDALQLKQTGLVYGSKEEAEAALDADDTPEETTTTTPVDTTPATSVTIPDVTTPVTQPATVSVTPDPVELKQAQKVFSTDGVVTLPTAPFAMPPVQTPTVTAPEGVTMEQSPTFQANVDRQVQEFQDRANLQAQNLQPQTLAEKTAAGTTGMIEQRLYRNPQGMTLYITGTIDPNGVWNPTNPIPQGYAPVQNFSNGGMTGWDASTNTYRIEGNAVGVIPPAQFNQFVKNVTGQEYTGSYRPGDSMSNPDVATGTIALTSGVDNIQPVTQTGGTGTTPVNLNTATNTNTNTGTNTNTNTNTNTDTNTDTNTTTSGTTGGQSPMFNVGGQDITLPQLAQGQANLSASAMLNPAGTIVAAAPAYVNPDTAGTVLPATTGQAPGVAPIVTNPAMVGQVATADTPAPVQTPTATAQTAQEGVQTALDQTQAAQSTGPTQTIQAATQDPTSTLVGSVDAAQIGTAQKVQGAPTRTMQEGEMISGSTVDQRRVGQAFGTGEVQAATVKDELSTLMQDFEEGDTPAWAAGAMRNALAGMASRGLGASSLAGQAAIQAAMESALPIAMADASNKQQMAMLKAEQRAKFLNMEFDQNFQTKVMNAARVSEIANMNFNAQQQVALENARMAQTVDLANLSNRQALVMAEAAQISQLETQNLSNIQQARVQNAQNFLQIDMANLSNKQQTELFKAQTLANTILSDTAAQNAFAQFNASNQIQVDQFNNTMSAQLSQFNSAQTNAMAQFNAGEANAIMKFNSELQNQRETFNATMSAQIAQANAKWRQDVTLTNTAAANESNFQFAKDVNALTNKSIDQIWQRERDLMSYAMTSSENALDRAMNLLLGDKDLEALRIELDAKEKAAAEAGKASLFSRFLFGSGYKGGFEGLLGDIF